MVEFVRALAGLYLPEEREGQGLVEYALIILLVALIVIVLLSLLGGTLNNVFSRISNSLNKGGARQAPPLAATHSPRARRSCLPAVLPFVMPAAGS